MRPLSFEREEEFVRCCDGVLILEREPSAARQQSDSGRRPGSFPRQEARIISASRAPMSLLVQYVFYPPLGRPHPLPRPHPLHPPSHPPPPPPRQCLTPPPTPPTPEAVQLLVHTRILSASQLPRHRRSNCRGDQGERALRTAPGLLQDSLPRLIRSIA